MKDNFLRAGVLSIVAVVAIAAVVLPGCASIPQAQLDSILKDLQGCKRTYNLATGGGAGLPATQFSAAISCEPTVPTIAPAPAPAPAPAQ